MSNDDSIKTKILIVEHNLNDIEFITRELKTGGFDFIFEIVESEQLYRDALKIFIPDIILSNYFLSSFNGNIAFKIRKMLPQTLLLFLFLKVLAKKNLLNISKKV